MNDERNPINIRPAGSSGEFEIPSDVVTLPSKGLVYPKDSPLHGKEELQVQYLTAAQEDIITSPNLIQTGKMVSVLLKSVIKDKINVDELTLGDRNTILIWLRSTGYGSEYPVEIRCKECGESYEHEFKLADLEMRTLEEPADEEGLLTFTLPIAKKIIKFRFLNSKDELDILKTVTSRQKKLKTKINNSLSMKMLKVVKEIDGNDDKAYIKEFLSRMTAKDSLAFRIHMQNTEPGILMVQDAQCTSCGEITEEVTTIQGNFFWPES